MLDVSEPSAGVFVLTIRSPRLPEDEARFGEALERALGRERFALVIEVHGEKNFSPEAKRDLNLWFKSHKGEIERRCRGLFRVRTESFDPDEAKVRALEAALPCPYGVFASAAEALAALVEPRNM